MAQKKRMAKKGPAPYALVHKFPDGWYYRLGSGPAYPWLGPFETEHVATRVREHATGGPWGYPKARAHAAKRSPVVGSHGLGTADVRTGDGAYWIVTVPTGYRVDYKPWGPSNEVDLGTFASRQRARAKITEHARGVGASVRHATKKKAGGAHQKWNVYSGGKWITAVFYVPNMDADEVRRSLIRHDGYPDDIKVRRAK